MNNPLAIQAPQRAPSNALMSQQPPAPGQPQQPISPAQLAKHIDVVGYSAAKLGALAHKPDLTGKDVVSEAGQAVADGKITASDAVNFLSKMPQDPASLRNWVDQQYMQHIATVVGLKSLAMGGQPQPQPQASAAPAPQPQQPQQNSAPAPGAAPEPMPTHGV